MELNLALKTLRVVSQVMGLNMEGWLGRAYTSALFLIITSFLYASYVDLSSGQTEILTEVDSLIMWAQFAANGIFVYVVLTICLIKPRQFLFPINEMRQVDVVLRFFGAKMNDTRLYRLQSLQVFTCLIMANLLGARKIYRAIDQKSFLIFFHWLHYSYAVSLVMTTDYLFVDYLYVINKRFAKLNQLLEVIIERNKPTAMNIALLYVVERNNVRKQSTQSLISDVERLRLLHHDLCSVSKKVNKSFGFQQLVSTTISLVMITGQLYEAYHFLLADENPVEIVVEKIMWIVFHVARLFHISYACSRASHEASFTSSIIHDVPLHQVSNGLIAQMQHFSLQLVHENVNFNACGFFDIDFTLLCSIVGVVTTYLVILIQMDRKMHCV